MNALRERLALLVLAVAVLALSGCGVSLEGASEDGSSGPVERVAPGGDQQAADDLPQRPLGVVRIAGKAQGSLTEALIEAYGGSAADAGFELESSDEAQAFDEFCAGEADLVDSARPISPAEYARCREHGIEPVQIQIAADAAVLAIENETDVGVDCLSVPDVREIFRAASPVTNWSQVGYGSRPAVGPNALPIKVAGPDARSNVFGFFGSAVLGDPEPSPVLLRGDYEAFPSDRGVLRAVAGREKERMKAERSSESARVLRELEAALDDASRAVAIAEFQVEKGIEDERSAGDQAADSERLELAEEKLAELSEEVAVAAERAERDEGAAERVAKRYGTLGLFRFSYYELWEERLRPMEIEVSEEGGPQCVFPSQSTVTDASYPLARQLLLTVDLETMREAEVNEFLSFAVANSERVAIEKALVPLPEEVRNTELAWLEGEMPPDVVYYPQSQIVQDERDSG